MINRIKGNCKIIETKEIKKILKYYVIKDNEIFDYINLENVIWIEELDQDYPLLVYKTGLIEREIITKEQIDEIDIYREYIRIENNNNNVYRNKLEM